VFPEIDPGATYNFAGSDDLATQIQQRAPADVFAAASPKYADQLYADGLVDKPEVFATNKLVLIVPKNNPAEIHSVDDLRNKDVKLVIGAEGVPIGDYTRTVLANTGATDVLDQVASEEDDVKGVVGKVALGEADAGFVYVTDVKPVADKVTAIELPASAQAVVEYEIAVVKDAPHHDAAHAYVEQVLGDDGRSALSEAGFGLP
ncbi:MAG TPA: molybdate ABC transporter substrate-binding protein, partial [Gaiellaceae bacterium]|nr:molybdate ABC transporter substrate-binding protein [Gaiellaceae bacterium]